MEKIIGRAELFSSRAIALALMRCPAPTPLLVTIITAGKGIGEN